MSESLPEVLDAAQAARLLHVGRNTLYELTRQGVIPHAHVGRRLVYSRRQLIEWVESGGGSKDRLLGLHLSVNQHARAHAGTSIVSFRKRRARA